MKTYSASIKNKKILKQSSSGGVFYCIAYYYINNLNGVVYGATINNGKVFHKRIDKKKNIFELMKSKYVHSDLNNSFLDCANDLENGKHVFFVGTPCQVASLIKYLSIKNIYTGKLLTADIFCHGVPSKKYWNLYIDELTRGSNDFKVDFRYKKPSWENYSIKVKGKGVSYTRYHKNDPYMVAFLNNYILMDTCYKCFYKGENRLSDLSIGDFWGINHTYLNHYNFLGTSVVVIRNKIEDITNIISNFCYIKEVDYHLALYNNPSYFQSPQKPHDIDDIKYKIENNGFFLTFRSSQKRPRVNKFLIRLLHLFRKRILTRINNKSVGIITDYDYKNFGNRLQNYALSKILKDMGYQPINITNSPMTKYYFSKRYYMFKENKQKRNKIKSFYQVSKKSHTIDIGFFYDRYSTKIITKFKNVIFGSDQIWNTNYNYKNIPFHLGLFGVDDNINKISYAASFGTQTLDKSFSSIFKYALNNMSHIGVREYEGVSIVKELGLLPSLNVDPIFLLDINEWNYALGKYSKSKPPSNEYVFVYMLGNEQITSDNNENYLDIMDIKSHYYSSNYFDFVNYIKNSKYVITNSFHAIAFSLLYKKKVIVYPRAGNESRIITLFNLININYVTYQIIDLGNVNLNKINQLRQISLDYLKCNMR